jgi:hypothetical protein
MAPNPEKPSTSPERGSFQIDRARERAAQETDPEKVETRLRLVELLEELNINRDAHEMDPVWRENNLEYDLRTTPWIIEKARANRSYAQNIYAALCNQDWQRIDVLPILRDESWSCTWRTAGGIVADILGEGDYIDWYCSGIRGHPSDDPDDAVTKHYVGEGCITEEIQEDFFKLGWQPFNDDSNNEL